jgi:hypothetical protein
MPSGIEDRDADVWEPLLAIADAVGGDWPVRARGAALALVGAARDAEPSLGIKLLADLKTLFDASTLDAMPTEVILSRLTELPESPWGDLGGKPINDRKLGRRLREYGVKSRAIRVGDKTPRGYLREDLQDAWLRYLPALDAAEAQQAQQAQQGLGTGGSSQENVAETEENERNGSATSATDVADSKRNSPSERNGNNPTKSSAVADVVDVALVPGIRRDDRTCAQCNADGEPLVRVDGIDPPVWLHPECRPFWAKANRGAVTSLKILADHSKGADPGPIPAFLDRTIPADRRPALGPEGDSLDDFR